MKYNTPDLVKDLPPQFLAFMKHLKTLNYADRPDYNHLYTLMLDLYHSVGCDDHTPFDWEVSGLRSPQYVSTPQISTQDVDGSREKSPSNINNNNVSTTPQMGIPSNLALSRTLPEDDFNSPPMSPAHSQASKHDFHNNATPKNNNNLADSRRDSHSAIAPASTSSDNKTGSWGKDPKLAANAGGTGGGSNANLAQPNASSATKPEDVQVSVKPALSNSKSKLPPDKANSRENLRKKKEDAGCTCTIL